MSSTSPPFDLKEVVDLHTKSVNLYHSVGHIIRTKVRSGEWKVGQKIPSERSLSASLNVSRATVRQGIDNLVKEGILRKEQGRGTFIAPPKLKQGVLRLLEFADILRESGLQPIFELLGKEMIVPTPDIAARLKLSHDDPLIWMQRLLYVNDSPMLIETSFIPAGHFPEGEPRHSLAQLDGRKGVRDVLIEWCGVNILRAHEIFEPVILEDAEAHQLGVEGGAPALWVELLAFDIGEEPVAYTTILIRGDRCRFYTDITFG
jgi:GntR family transcriptional regulator